MENNKSTAIRICGEIVSAISNSLEKYKFDTPGEYIYQGKLLDNDTVRAWFGDNPTALNHAIGGYFLEQGGHFAPSNRNMEKYLLSHGYDKYDSHKIIQEIVKKILDKKFGKTVKEERRCFFY